MLDRLDKQPPDALLALIALHDADTRSDKIDLGVGVYRTADGATPVFEAVKAAEGKLLEQQTTKAYLGPEGDMGFVKALMPHIFGADCPVHNRLGGMQTPGGTGAVRLAAALAMRAGVTHLAVGTPTWPNHNQICADLGLDIVGYPHAAPDGSANMQALRQALRGMGKGDAILLHGACHNPTGIDYTPQQWDEIADLLAETGVLPILDLAYHGLGNGMEEDAYGVRAVLAKVPEALVCYSCDKNFGYYRDRVGALYALGANADDTQKIMTNAFSLARANWSMPPDHGASVVRLILEDEALTKSWLDEVASMRARIGEVRAKLAEAGQAGAVDLKPLGEQKGMFAMLPLSKDQVITLREEHGVYMAGNGRINIAGLTLDNIDKFVGALAAVS